MEQVTTEIIKLTVLITVLFIARYLIPLIKSRLQSSDIKLAIDWALTFVKAAEVIYSGNGKGDDKLAQVTIWMSSKLSELGICMDNSDIRAIIEQAVDIMHKESDKNV